MVTIRNRWLVLAWLALVATGVVSNVLAIRQLQMEAAPLSTRYTDHAFPAAISALRGLTDYTAYAEVAAVFIHHKDKAIADNISLAKTVAINDPNTRWFISGDDKGLVDFVYLGFQLFGTAITSLYLLIGVVCLVSVVLYSMAFCRSGPKMALLVATLAAFYAVLFTFGLTDQSASIIEPRFLGFIGVVPLLHVLITLTGRKEPDRLALVLAALQVSIIVLVVHMRGSEIWQIFCILAVCFLSQVVRKRYSRAGVAIATVVLVMAGALTAYRHATYHDRYLTTDVSSRVFWHNAVMGLAANPAIRERFKLQILQDQFTTEAIKRYLTDTHQDTLRGAIFSDTNYAVGSFQNFKWSLYEPVARDFYFHIAAQMPLEMLRTYFVIMPKIFVASASYMTGSDLMKGYQILMGRLETPSQRRTNGHYLNPFRVLPVIFVLASALFLTLGNTIFNQSAIIAIITAIAGAAMPAFFAMPVVQYIQVLTLVLLSGVYLFSVMAIAVLLRRALTFSLDAGGENQHPGART